MGKIINIYISEIKIQPYKKDDNRCSVSSGVYFAQLKMQTKEFNNSKLIKMVYLK